MRVPIPTITVIRHNSRHKLGFFSLALLNRTACWSLAPRNAIRKNFARGIRNPGFEIQLKESGNPLTIGSGIWNPGSTGIVIPKHSTNCLPLSNTVCTAGSNYVLMLFSFVSVCGFHGWIFAGWMSDLRGWYNLQVKPMWTWRTYKQRCVWNH